MARTPENIVARYQLVAGHWQPIARPSQMTSVPLGGCRLSVDPTSGDVTLTVNLPVRIGTVTDA